MDQFVHVQIPQPIGLRQIVPRNGMQAQNKQRPKSRDDCMSPLKFSLYARIVEVSPHGQDRS